MHEFKLKVSYTSVSMPSPVRLDAKTTWAGVPEGGIGKRCKAWEYAAAVSWLDFTRSPSHLCTRRI